MKYQIIVIDPPYGNFRDKLKMSDVKRSAEDNYKTMTLSDIKTLPIKELADPSGAVLALWVPSSMIEEGLDLMKRYGFTQKQIWTWVKIKKHPLQKVYNSIKKLSDKKDIKKTIDNFDLNNILTFGMGRISRNVDEHALIGTCGKITKMIKNKSERNVFFDQNYRHSQKTEILQDKLDKIFPDATNRLEIFGRRLRDNWTVIGNESPSTLGEDILESIKKLREDNVEQANASIK